MLHVSYTYLGIIGLVIFPAEGISVQRRQPYFGGIRGEERAVCLLFFFDPTVREQTDDKATRHLRAREEILPRPLCLS